MKEIIAVVRMNMMNRTKQALTDAGIDAFFAAILSREHRKQRQQQQQQDAACKESVFVAKVSLSFLAES